MKKEGYGFSLTDLTVAVLGSFSSGNSSEAAKKLANILDTTVGYLLGETEDPELFRDRKMLQHLQDIMKLPERKRSSILLTLDHLIKASKINLI